MPTLRRRMAFDPGGNDARSSFGSRPLATNLMPTHSRAIPRVLAAAIERKHRVCALGRPKRSERLYVRRGVPCDVGHIGVAT